MKTLLQRVRNTYLSLTATTFGRVTKHVDHCPHCNDRTTWAVRVLTGYARCLQCGHNPLDRHDVASNELRESVETAAPAGLSPSA